MIDDCPILVSVEIYDNDTHEDLINEGYSVCTRSHAAQLLREWADKLEGMKS